MSENMELDSPLHDKFGQTCFDSRLLDHIKNQQDDALVILKNMSDPGHLVDGTGKTLLHFAAFDGADRVAEYLIESGADINAQDHEGTTPLMQATSCSRITSIFLDHNANIHIRDKDGKNAFHHFPDRLVSMIFQKLSDEHSGDVEKITSTLIDWNCSVYCGLHLRNARITRQLLAHGCPLEYAHPCDMIPDSALGRAVFNKDLENVQILLDHGVDVNAESPNGTTALFLYGKVSDTINQKPEILRLLLDRGANPMQSITANIFRRQGKMQISSILKNCSREIIRLLLERNIDLYARDAIGSTAVHYIAKNHRPGVFQELQGRKYDANARNDNGQTPLHWMPIKHPNLTNVSMLLDEGADINAEDAKGLTPLMRIWGKINHYYLWGQDIPIERREKAKRLIEYFLAHGADCQLWVNEDYSLMPMIEYASGSYWMQPVLMHLALIKARGTPINRVLGREINKNAVLRKHLEMCTRQLEEMKQVNVWKSATLYDLVTANQRKLERYVSICY